MARLVLEDLQDYALERVIEGIRGAKVVHVSPFPRRAVAKDDY